MQEVPPHIVQAINALLAPYGRTYSLDAPQPLGSLNPKEAAAFLSVSLSTLNRWIAAGEIPVIKYSERRFGRIAITIADLQVFQEAHRQVR